MASQKYVIGNWKMNGSLLENERLIAGIRTQLPAIDPRVSLVVTPPFPYLPQVAGLIDGCGIELAGQNMSEQKSGAYTGDVSCAMLKDMGVKYVLMGHSERRSYHGEDDLLIAKKIRAALDAGLTPVFCIGETQQEREANETWIVLLRQLDAAFDLISLGKDQLILAYEPRWAIGTGVSATPEMIADVHGFLRTYLIAKDAELGANTPILYGGSMNGSNAASIAAIENVDGGLIGSASLKAEEFVSIYQAVLATYPS